MDFLCEDLPEHGLLLIPPSAADYATLFGHIEHRVDHPVDGALVLPERMRPQIAEQDRPTSAILVNRSEKTIAGLEVVWRFDTAEGRTFRHSREMLSPRKLLLPFGEPPAAVKLAGYWQTILPQSKRYLGESGMLGDNSDVRLPNPDEKYPAGGGVIGGIAGGSSSPPAARVTLVLDGVFFVDGEFLGPDYAQFFDRTVAQAEAYTLVAKIARQGHDNGVAPAQILAEIEKATGPAPQHLSIPPGGRGAAVPREALRQWALQDLALQFNMQRRFPQFNEEQAVYRIMSWTETSLPNFRKG